MYKKANSFLSILLVTILLFCSINIPVLAYDAIGESSSVTQITPRFTTISHTIVTFEISGINAKVTASLTSRTSTSLNIKIELQKEKSTGYETIETWTKSGTGTYLIIEESRLINVLSEYRVKVTFTAGSESTYMYKYPA